eukprot:evm.model.scf_21EXC.10 EVM.evm.TU.scf_21EXC.10   scf_21EXC:103031-104086(+)
MLPKRQPGLKPAIPRLAVLVAAMALLSRALGRADGLRRIFQADDGTPVPRLSTGGTSMSLNDFSDLTSCAAQTSASFTLVGSGSASASASASCEAKAESTSAATQAIADFLNGTLNDHPQYCGEEMIVTVAAAVGEAVATAYASAEVSVEVSGSGTACADASAEADAFAVSLAKAVLRDAVETTRDVGRRRRVMKPGNNSLCLSASLSVVFARAWAQAKASACQEGQGGARDEEESIARSVQQAVARVLVEVARKSCPANNRLRLDAAEQSLGRNYTVDAVAERVAAEEFASGLAEASGGALTQCDANVEAQCCGDDTSECRLARRPGLTVKSPGGEKCCCLLGLLPYYEQ